MIMHFGYNFPGFEIILFMYDDTNDDSKVDSVHLIVFAIEESDADGIDHSTGFKIMYCVEYNDEAVDKDIDVSEVFVMVDKGEAIGCADDKKVMLMLIIFFHYLLIIQR